MSDLNQIVIRIDPAAEDERRRLADSAVAWLTGIGVIAPSQAPPEERARFGYGDWQPGPAWRDAVEATGGPFGERYRYGVSITAERMVESAMGNSEPPACRTCGAQLALDGSFGELVEAWLAGDEPMAACAACRWAAPLGDWPTAYPPALVGAPTIRFENWPALRDGFVTDLTTRLGGRCRYFWQRV